MWGLGFRGVGFTVLRCWALASQGRFSRNYGPLFVIVYFMAANM